MGNSDSKKNAKSFLSTISMGDHQIIEKFVNFIKYDDKDRIIKLLRDEIIFRLLRDEVIFRANNFKDVKDINYNVRFLMSNVNLRYHYLQTLYLRRLPESVNFRKISVPINTINTYIEMNSCASAQCIIDKFPNHNLSTYETIILIITKWNKKIKGNWDKLCIDILTNMSHIDKPFPITDLNLFWNILSKSASDTLILAFAKFTKEHSTFVINTSTMSHLMSRGEDFALKLLDIIDTTNHQKYTKKYLGNLFRYAHTNSMYVLRKKLLTLHPSILVDPVLIDRHFKGHGEASINVTWLQVFIVDNNVKFALEVLEKYTKYVNLEYKTIMGIDAFGLATSRGMMDIAKRIAQLRKESYDKKSEYYDHFNTCDDIQGQTK